MNTSSTIGQTLPESTPVVATTIQPAPTPAVTAKPAVAGLAPKSATKAVVATKSVTKPAAGVSRTSTQSAAPQKPSVKKIAVKSAVPKKVAVPASKAAVASKTPVTKAVATKAVVTKAPAVKAPVARKAALPKVSAPFKASVKPVPKKQVVTKALVRSTSTVPATAKAKLDKSTLSGAVTQTVAKSVDIVSPKAKLVRDSFTMPQKDFALIAVLKDRALSFKRPTKKSELLRAGLHALAVLNAAALRTALESLTPLPTGRPKNTVR